jgi:alkanesulfonate monooxygenase SsuD/methylene tetrahydromethanopterin reductase-like flavin-dependent oxidoreductase (luciferase family)
MTTLDVLSAGRTIFALGTGYLRSEFAALGVDFAERNELFDEAVEVLRGVWSTEEFHFEGRHFKALGVSLKPNVVQRPHPPLWLGGNSRVVRERVAAWGQGWSPLVGSAQVTTTSRTKAIGSDEELGTLVADIKDRMAQHGRDPESLDVLAQSTRRPAASASAGEMFEAVAGLESLGVTWTSLPVPRRGLEAALEAITRFGDEIISRMP